MSYERAAETGLLNRGGVAGTALRWIWPLLTPALLVLIVVIPAAQGPVTLQRTATVMLINLILVVGLYMFVGNSGVFSFGHASFMAIGAYASALLSMPVTRKSIILPDLPGFLATVHFPQIAAILVAALFAAAFSLGVAVPLMRLSGITAGIATFAVLVIVQVVVSNWDTVTGSNESLTGVPITTTLADTLVWALVTMATAFLFQETATGLRLRASREDEVAAIATGIHIEHERRIAFVLSAFFVAIGGALFGHYLGAISPNTFFLQITFITIAMLVVGGINSLAGAVVGTIVVSVLAEGLRLLEAGVGVGAFHLGALPGLREIGLALLMLFILLFRPEGIMGGNEMRWPWRG